MTIAVRRTKTLPENPWIAGRHPEAGFIHAFIFNLRLLA
jgi:hypothetical protein